jgi:3' exoribonuclease, RNase T-like
MWIATGDIETLSQSRNSVIIEAAFIAVNVNSYTDQIPFEKLKTCCAILNDRNYTESHAQIYEPNFQILVVNFSLSEQIVFGRDLNLDTMRFHCRDEAARSYLMKSMARCSRGPIANAYLREIQVFLSKADEIWFNGLSFDPPNLCSLAEQAGMTEPLWHFRKESDIRTLYKRFAMSPATTAEITNVRSHTALNDCIRNLMNIQALHDAHSSEDGIQLKMFPGSSVNAVANSTQP